MLSGATLHHTKAGAAAAPLIVLDTPWSLQNKAEREDFAMEMIVN